MQSFHNTLALYALSFYSRKAGRGGAWAWWFYGHCSCKRLTLQSIAVRTTHQQNPHWYAVLPLAI